MARKKPGRSPRSSPAKVPPPRPVPLKLFPRKLWLFRCAAVLLPFVLFGVLELVFRVVGIGPDVRLILRVPGQPAGLTHQLNGAVDLAYYGAADLMGPEPRRFTLPKPKDTYRIVFLGESTVIGFPYAPEIAFPRQVEVQLQQQNPELRFEVLNVGITAINSFAVVDLLQQCLACDPDLIVIHAGHNEFYGPGGPASTAGRLPYSLIGPMFALRRSRVLQFVQWINPFRGPMRDDLLDTLPRTLEIPLDGPVFEQARENYRRNLERATSLAERHHVPLLLSTMACNLKDQGPMKSISPAGISSGEQTQWERAVRNGESLLQNGDHQAALEAFHRAEQMIAGNARLSYRIAQCLEALGRNAEALSAYQKARDEDACRFRAPSAFAQIVRDTVDKSAKAKFLDVEQLVNSESSPAGPGADDFLEHVHYTFDGHVSLGRIFARGIQEQVLNRPWSPEREPSRPELETLLGVVPEDHLAAYSSTIEVLQTGPLKAALDAPRHEAEITKRIGECYYELNPARREAFADIPINFMVNDLIGSLTYIHQVRGNAELSQNFARLAAVRRPWFVGVPPKPQ
ncbi:MAG: tetratricopeptide repeat protein [Planctomycetaceae bacterium]|nr:tetratricopeptide repeat protein [Planctomycetaceae bacterium]